MGRVYIFPPTLQYSLLQAISLLFIVHDVRCTILGSDKWCPHLPIPGDPNVGGAMLRVCATNSVDGGLHGREY